MSLSSFSSHDEYINSKFSSKKRGEFRSIKRRLEQCFEIKYCFLNSKIPKNEFNNDFRHFYVLLSKRFSNKQTNFHH